MILTKEVFKMMPRSCRSANPKRVIFGSINLKTISTITYRIKIIILACFCVLTSVYLLFVISSVKFISSHSTDDHSDSTSFFDQSAIDIALNEPLDALIFIFQLIFKLQSIFIYVHA